jgi:RHS repeat-associated protein
VTVTKDGALAEEYQYDNVGRRTFEMNTLRGISGRTSTYSDEDHLLTTGDTIYQYDLDGFLSTKTRGPEVTRYNYSSRGELLNATLPDARVIEYIHDPLGRRIAKKVDGAITEKYLWQGLTRLLAVYDGSENLVMRFEYANGRMPMAMSKAGSTYYLTYDQVGSLRIVADTLGNVVKRIDYDSFGNIISDTNPGFWIPFGFAGGLHDRDTVLVRFGFRDYEPDIGRWTAKDPILFIGGDVDLFGYVENNPVNWNDPWGLSDDATFWTWYGPDQPGLEANPLIDPVNVVAAFGASTICTLGKPAVTGALGFFPTKTGGGRYLQHFSRETGRWVDESKPLVNKIYMAVNRESTNFIAGVGFGFAEGRWGSPAPMAVTPAQKLGQFVGRIVGNIGGGF